MKQDDFEEKNKRIEVEASETLDNFNAELSGTKAGYIYVTGASDRESRPDIRTQKARKADAAFAQLSALQQLLTDPDYAKAYHKSQNGIASFKARMAERLEQLDKRIETLDEKLENHAPGSADHKRLMQQREDLQRRQQELWDYHNNTIRPIEEHLDDPGNPPSKEELEEFNDKVQLNMDNFFPNEPDASSLHDRDNRPPMGVNLPSIG